MPRIIGIDVPDNKRIEIAITYIYGIGPAIAERLLEECKIDPNKRAKDLNDDEVASIRNFIEKENLLVEGELRRSINQNVRRLRDIKSYRGSRHARGLPVRGQRTSTNARTRKGKRKTVGGAQKKATAKK